MAAFSLVQPQHIHREGSSSSTKLSFPEINIHSTIDRKHHTLILRHSNNNNNKNNNFENHNAKKRTVLNPLTNRQIQIGGKTFKEIMNRGGSIAYNGKLIPIIFNQTSTKTTTTTDEQEPWHILTPRIIPSSSSSSSTSSVSSLQKYLQTNFLFVYKPPNLNTVPSKLSQHCLTTQIEQSLKRKNNHHHQCLKPCHRLDRDTSGIVAYGLTPQAHKYLSIQFQNRTVRKRYVALVYGRVHPPQGSIEIPIGKEFTGEFNKWVLVHGGSSTSTQSSSRPAHTEYIVSNYYDEYTKVVLVPKTGRGHQLRLHMKSMGNGILGDGLHFPEKCHVVPRLCLHADRLEFDVELLEGGGGRVCVECAAPF